MDLDKALTHSSRFLAFSGLAAIAFGIVVLVWPGLSLEALIALFGAFALVYGALGLSAGLNLLAHRSTDWVPYVVAGLAGVAIGAVTFFRPGITALVLLYVIAGWAIVTGVFEVMAAVNVHGGRSGAFWLGIGGLLSIIFGAVVAIWPISGALAILWLIGVYSIVFGVTRVVFAYRVHAVQGGVRRTLGRVEARS